MILLGARLLLRRPQRLVTAAAGIVMAVAIMMVQAGMLSGVLEAEARIASLARGDFVVMNARRLTLHDRTPMPLIRLAQLSGLAEVERVMPVYEGAIALRPAARPGQSRDAAQRPFRRIITLSFSATDLPLSIGEPERIEQELKSPQRILFDRQSRGVYGAIRAGDDVEFQQRRWHVGGLVEIGPDIVNDGAIVMSTGNAQVRDWPVMGVVVLKPSIDLQAARQRILARLGGDAVVLTPAELRLREIAFTLGAAPIGILFGVGMLAGLSIGAISCYQVLFNEITDHLKMYTTLKAAGFSDWFLRRAIIEQAVLLSAVGFAGGLLIASALGVYLTNSSGFSVRLAVPHMAVIFAITLVACVGAGLLAVRQVIASDPAELL